MTPQPTGILIVEDEQLVAIDIQSQLERLGYRVVATAACGEDAIAKAAEFGPDLVLMDVRIEGPMDGIEVAQEIGRLHPAPVVFLTAYTDLETLRRAKMALPYGYVVKPFEQRDLEAAIQIALEKSAADRQIRKSHDDLRTILDAQRYGTVMLDAAGRITFASRAALRTAHDDRVMGRTLEALLPLSAEQIAAVDAMCGRPIGNRRKVPIMLDGDGPRQRHLEVEVADDPRDDAGRILFIYDVSPLVDLRRQLDEQAAFERIVGKSKAMQQVFQLIRDVARVNSTVLIEGETGTGKELVARAIHHCSPRRAGPLLALNCAGLSDELAGSQLFGHRHGSFTGAVDDQQGLFEAAGGGTLFLDEIGELPIRVQTTLLRALEENAVLRLGETKPRPVDVRVLAATHRDLAHEVAEGRFRQDLLYRIRVARIRLPALRERREDIPLLVRAFLADLRAVTGKQVEALSDDAMAVVIEYDWPGNVRELRNALEFALIRSRGTLVELDDFPPELLEVSPAADPDELSADEAGRVQSALKRAKGNRTRAATMLGISRATLYRRLREMGIDET
ncbi:MAG: sigma 54-interacting transcriptional regulator [Planctomycetaceae bacterium]|nr:sigma 54-interacting transcriptional regulator [Planctomycetaceae bacterium]